MEGERSAAHHRTKRETDAEELRAIQEEIARARAEVARSVMALRDRVARSVDWRSWVRSRPRVAFLLSFGLGVWVGLRRR